VSVLRHPLDGAISPGLSQTIHPDRPLPARRQIVGPALDPSSESRIDFLLANASSWPELESELRALAAGWERDRRPLAAAEPALRQITAQVLRSSGNLRAIPPDELEYLLDGLLSRASSWEELAAGAWDIVRHVLGMDPGEGEHDGGAPRLHAAILRFVEQNCGEPLTLQSVCDRFHVSQTYVSRLFRRFERASFVEYLTRFRVQLAKRLITECPGMPLKDVAAYAGYHDPFYFSRVFKTLTGVPPSEWKPGSGDV
jgi:two-component system, response regulator YesN